MKKELSIKQRDELFKILKSRFEKNMNRHKGLDWAKVQARLEANPEKLWSLNEMERTGGEPDVVGLDKKTGEYIFFDCSPESPKGRVAYCYDRGALDSRKEHKPKNSAMDMAASMRIQLLTEEQYRSLESSTPKPRAAGSRSFPRSVEWERSIRRSRGRKTRPGMSVAGRARVAAAQRKRWATLKKPRLRR